jgi:ribosomal protein S27AE
MNELIKNLQKEEEKLFKSGRDLDNAIRSLCVITPESVSLKENMIKEKTVIYEKGFNVKKQIDNYRRNCPHIGLAKVDSTPHGDRYECPNCGYSETY